MMPPTLAVPIHVLLVAANLAYHKLINLSFDFSLRLLPLEHDV